MTQLTLVRTRSCPYVQKVEIALAEKRAEFETTYVDLADRPDWFKQISPLGKVPVLKVERDGKPDATIFESSVIVEFIEEFLPAPNLHPADPVARAQARSWMEFGSALLPEVYGIWMAKDADSYDGARGNVAAKLVHLEAALADGPYFSGESFSCVDLVFAPLFGKIEAFESLAPLGLLESFAKIAAWIKAVQARPSVRQTTPENQAETLDRALNIKEGYAAKSMATA